MSTTKYTFFSLFVVFVLIFGCINIPGSETETGEQTDITSPFKQSGCQYDNPSCKSGYECINNKCIDKKILSDLTSHGSILSADTAELNTLSQESSTIIGYYNIDLSNLSKVTVSPGKDGYLYFYLKKGYVLQGTISVSGGSGNDVDFALEDSTGKKHLSKSRMSGSNTITFTAPSDGSYRIYLSNKFSTFSSKYVTFDFLNSRYYYFQQYVTWSKKYANKVELMTQHITAYENFIVTNEDTLKDAGYNTVNIKSSLSDRKTILKQSVQGVNDNINSMKNYFEQMAALKQQEQQAAAEVISTLIKIFAGLG